MNRECREIRDVMDSYASGELLVETNHAVLNHLASCDECASELERRQETATLLRKSFAVPLDVDVLRRRMGAALDREQSWWPRAARTWSAAAAGIALVALAIWHFGGSSRVDASAYQDSVSDHIECALTFPAGASYDPQRVARRLPARFAGLTRQIEPVSSPYQLVDAHACPYQQRRYAHFIFRGEGSVVSLFIEERGERLLPATPATTTLPSVGGNVYHIDEKGYRVAATATRGHQLFVVSDRKMPRPDEVAGSLLVQAVRFMQAIER